MIWFFRPQGFDCVKGHQVHCLYLHVCLQGRCPGTRPHCIFFHTVNHRKNFLPEANGYTIISLLFYHFIKIVLRVTLIWKTFIINIKKKTSNTGIINIKKRLHQYTSLLFYYYYFHLMLQLISSKKPLMLETIFMMVFHKILKKRDSWLRMFLDTQLLYLREPNGLETLLISSPT